MRDIDYAISIRPYFSLAEKCGDTARVYVDKDCFLALIDVLGHGANARQIAIIAENYLDEFHEGDLIKIMRGMQKLLFGTRGAVVACCRFDKESGKLDYSGIGNISLKIFGISQTTLITKDGIVGYGDVNPHEGTCYLKPGDVFLMSTDGIREHFDILDCKDLLQLDAASIASGIIKRFATKEDDAACIVMKYLK